MPGGKAKPDPTAECLAEEPVSISVSVPSLHPQRRVLFRMEKIVKRKRPDSQPALGSFTLKVSRDKPFDERSAA